MTAGQHQVPAIFGQRIKHERQRRGWNMRTLGAKTGGVSINTISRAERGSDLTLSNAIAIAAALGLSLDAPLAEPACAQCDDRPPEGFTCTACGREEAL